MKRLVFALSITILCLTFGIYCLFAVDKGIEPIKNDMLAASEALEKGDERECFVLITSAEKKWQSKQKLFSFIIGNQQTQQLSEDFSALLSLSKSGSEELSVMKIEECVSRLEEIADSQKPNIFNIL